MNHLLVQISTSVAVRCVFRNILVVFVVLLLLTNCKNKSRAEIESNTPGQATGPTSSVLAEKEPPHAKVCVNRAISISGFFKFMDEIVRQNDTLTSYKLNENVLLRANPWILDSLVNTDYYYQMSRGNFVYDQRKIVILKPGDTLLIPGPKTGAFLIEKMAATRLEINIPAFEMRILEGDSILFSLPVRVGKNQKKYLQAAHGEVDLRTKTGAGEIFRVNRYPLFIDPVTGEKFKFTKRDDHKTTFMPQIPWLEPMINGGRYGQLIHPTTNPRTLGKPASNGCIGVSEADAWRIYFYAPVGTKVLIRYDVQEINANGDTLRYDDIYRLKKAGKTPGVVAGAGFGAGKAAGICLCDTLF